MTLDSRYDLTFDFVRSAKRTISMEKDAIAALEERIGENFSKACQTILTCCGRVVVTGMGKSGHIAKKMAATLASTGTPSFFVHPGEANHGDLGMITSEDLVIAISNSGTSAEIVSLLPMLKRLGVPLISMTGKESSALAEAADINLDISVNTEACPLDLAPTSSTTATLVMGDALAVALLEARGFTAEDFAFSHPGGALGKKLLLRVSDLMHSSDKIPYVAQDAVITEALAEMSQKGFGMTTVTDDTNELLGIFTDGDLRRCLDKQIDVNREPISSVMSKNPLTVKPNTLAVEALNLMESRKITALVVLEKSGTIAGILHMHDLLRAGII
ncbi:KpsF/GutQ family sugar-phosphate isomerase [Teredinibacter sp. KSP-S5-2]|uniref:KpsF/GutQ family sugar-phosphate isomerase n=1 Tax=Teredinibacter sp. KSP-S5-2 TaxID=3034506 RepID=UPI0029351219|nr:KpsF/GutQ family sugar-phosphate isomerase [Teredinibacter sp. KSP-S5-2]WNO09591.1 KpsF/GutQ family sugar-phosphate isomerase [Teredinibacter sp. KSP-S5-2]